MRDNVNHFRHFTNCDFEQKLTKRTPAKRKNTEIRGGFWAFCIILQVLEFVTNQERKLPCNDMMGSELCCVLPYRFICRKKQVLASKYLQGLEILSYQIVSNLIRLVDPDFPFISPAVMITRSPLATNLEDLRAPTAW